MGVENLGSELGRRTQPKQKRAQERIEAIIDATLTLLDRLDANSVTTSAVAKEARIPVGSIYRYFPNIHAIYGTIFDRFHQENTRIIKGSSLDQTSEWKTALKHDLEAMGQLLESRAGYRAVVSLTFSTPELLPIREQWNHDFAEQFAINWRVGKDGFEGGNPSVVARMVVEIFSAAQLQILRNWDDKSKREAIAHERLVAMVRYLEAYLD